MMPKNRYVVLFITLLALFLSTLLTGCLTTGGSIDVDLGNPPEQEAPPPSDTNPPPGHGGVSNGHGPPAHAPAHGYRKKHEYRYYPDDFVYFDINRSLYFFIENGSWTMSAVLPGFIRLSTDFVTMELNTDKPYLENKKHKKKHPPAKKKKGKNKKKNKWD